MNPFEHGKDFIVGVIVIGVLATASVLTFLALQARERGIYAGYSYDDGRRAAAESFAENYGQYAASFAKLGIPDVVNMRRSGLTQKGQVRVFNVIGPEGIPYCVAVWTDGWGHHDGYIVKGCHQAPQK